MTERPTISADNFANVMGVSKATLHTWESNSTYTPHVAQDGTKFFYLDEIRHIPDIKEMLETDWDNEMQTTPSRDFYSIELFAGGGGLALGMSLAGFKHVLLNEFDHNAGETLRLNRPEWNVIEGDVCDIDFTKWRDKVDFISGGFPCQAFSYAGKGEGFNDTRGTLFFQLARAIKEIRPKVFLGENVRGLVAHDGGRTLDTIKRTIAELGYTLVEPRILKAIKYNVPQKRERLFLIGIRNDYAEKVHFEWPAPFHRVVTLRDAFYAGELFSTDVPDAPFQKYPPKKQKVLELVPEGGDWRDLPLEVQKDYMGASFYLGGGKTGMARRLSLDEPSLTLTCSPAQKQTERCHPIETRPLTVREYARIQTFPDDWQFAGNLTAQYKQIGNAVPVNLAWAVGRSLIRLLNQIDRIDKEAKNYIPSIETFRNLTRPIVRQLALFDPETLYISTNHNSDLTLIGTCRKSTIDWIKNTLHYNYPIQDGELLDESEIFNVKSILIIHKKNVVGYYDVKGIRIVSKDELRLSDYPIKSSKHRSDTKYLLFDLENTTIPISIDEGAVIKPVLGKGVKKG